MTKNFLFQQEISRLLTAAAINGGFRQALINNPGKAISSGFGGEVFHFNADVVLLIYRRINVDQISSSLAKKYYLSKDDSRRGVKRVINVLEQWGMVSE